MKIALVSPLSFAVGMAWTLLVHTPYTRPAKRDLHFRPAYPGDFGKFV